MKRRYLAILLIFILLITAVGCSKGNTSPKPSVSGLPDTLTDQPEEQSPVTSNPAATATPTIQGDKANASGTLYAVDEAIALPDYSIEGVYYYDNRTLVVCYRGIDGSFQVGLYDIYDAKLTKLVLIDYEITVDQCIIGDNGNIFLSSTWGNTFLLLDSELKIVLNSKEMPESFASVVSAYDGNTLYYLEEDGYTLNKYNVVSKVSTLVTTFSSDKLSLMLLQMTDDNKHLTVQYSNSRGSMCYTILNMETKEELDLEDYSDNVMTSGKMYSIADYDKISKGYMETFHIEQPRVLTKKYFVDTEEGNCFRLNGNTNTIVTVSKLPGVEGSTSGGVIRLYNADDMQVEKKTEIDRDVLIKLSGQKVQEDSTAVYYYINGSSMQVSEDRKTAFISYAMDDYTGLLIWDLEKEQPVSGSESQGLAFVKSDEIEAEDNDEYAEKIAKAYGVNIYIRDKVVRYFPDFAVNALYDENTTNEALKLVEEVLGRYPKGFFKELRYDDIKKFEIYLCGTLVQGSEYGISNPGGFALQYRNSQMVVMDVTYTGAIRNSLNHEIMHAMENKMGYLLEKGKLKASLFEKWFELNPKKHDYRYGYVDENGVEYDAVNNAAYTPNDEKSRNNVDNIYYIDYYANTFPNEDRARIFENLMIADTELSYEFNSKHLKAKAKYLCKMIRNTFTSIPDDEVMYWERFLQ